VAGFGRYVASRFIDPQTNLQQNSRRSAAARPDSS
jgi:hypothetical protein